MRQGASTSVHASLISRIADDLAPVIEAVAHDVGEPAAVVAPVVAEYVAMLGAGEVLAPEALGTLRTVGSDAARAGVPLQVALDRYLSTGWAVWAAAVRTGAGTADRDSLAALGSVLLRAGDAAAAAIADGHERAEREAVARDAAAYRGFVGELLAAPVGDPAAAARIARRAARFGLDPRATYAVIAVHPGRDVEDEGREIPRIADALLDPRSRPRPGGAIVAARGGRLVLAIPTAALRIDRLVGALADAAPEARWTAVRGPDAPRLADVAASCSEAMAALAVAERLPDRAGRIVDAQDVALERALLADEPTLRAAVARELGPIASAPRIGEALVETLRGYLDNGQSIRATSRALGIPARTVAYRIARVEEIIGAPLDGPHARRLAVALSGRDLLA